MLNEVVVELGFWQYANMSQSQIIFGVGKQWKQDVGLKWQISLRLKGWGILLSRLNILT